ncbi:hypothetical protein F1C14_04115 [Clostridium perfringens]|nr:hypothetical protein F1C14_04115 [Clostridium perfringens]
MSLICTGSPSFRELPLEATCDVGGSSIFFNNYCNYYYYIGLLNSNLSKEILNIINPTINFSTGVIAKLPIIVLKQNIVEDIVLKI